jgi:hypothetical protein
LVAKQKFSTATLNFLPVGHTHEDIDLLWAVVMARVLNKANILTPDEFAMQLRRACQISAVPKARNARQLSWKECGTFSCG